jgi:hypothetical protein
MLSKYVVALGQHLRQTGQKGRIHQVRPVHAVRHRHQAHQIDDAGNAVQVGAVERELLQQEIGHCFGTVVGNLQAHGVAEMALRQFALQRDAQVLHFFVIDEQVGVARDAELVAAEHVHAAEQFTDAGVEHGREEDEAVGDAAQRLGQADYARQRARRLDDGGAGTAAKGVGAFQLDGEVQALVQYPREGMRWVQADRREHRHDFADEVVANPGALLVGPQAAPKEGNPLHFQRGEDHVVEQGVLLANQFVRLVGDAAIDLVRRHAVGADGMAAQFELFLESGDADFEKLVEVGRDDAKKAQALEQRHAIIGGLGQYTPVEGKQGELPVEEMLGGKTAGSGHGAFREWRCTDYVSV